MKIIDASDLDIEQMHSMEEIPGVLEGLVQFLRYNEYINGTDENVVRLRKLIGKAISGLDSMHQEAYELTGYIEFGTIPTHHICNNKSVRPYPTLLCSVCHRLHRSVFNDYWLDNNLDVPYLELILRVANKE